MSIAERKKLSHAGPTTVNREAERPAPTGVGSGDLLNPAAARRAWQPA